MREPLLSVVIANYNFGKFLADAIHSILDQGCSDDVEVLVVDGGSSDNSVDVIRSFGKQISWWVSEKDSGQSDAFNKGFSHARGRMLTWLNADDVMPRGCLKHILHEIKKCPNCDWFTGNHLRFLESNKEIIQVEWGPKWYPACLQQKNSPLVIFGPTTFFSKRIYESVGRIDESFHLAMDTDLWLRFQSAGIKQRRINCFCWAFRMHGDSKTAEFEGHKYAEKSACAIKLDAEHKRAAAKVGYEPSKWLRIIGLALRVLDGSFVRRAYLRRKLLGTVYTIARENSR